MPRPWELCRDRGNIERALRTGCLGDEHTLDGPGRPRGAHSDRHRTTRQQQHRARTASNTPRHGGGGRYKETPRCGRGTQWSTWADAPTFLNEFTPAPRLMSTTTMSTQRDNRSRETDSHSPSSGPTRGPLSRPASPIFGTALLEVSSPTGCCTFGTSSRAFRQSAAVWTR